MRYGTWHFATIALSSLSLLVTACGAPAEHGLTEVESEGLTGDAVPQDSLTGTELAEGYALEGGWYVSPELEAAGATRVAAHVELLEDHAGASVYLEAQARRADGSVTGWLPLELGFSEDAFRSGYVEVGAGAQALQLRVREQDAKALKVLQWAGAIPETIVSPEQTGTAQQGLSSDLAALGVISRAQWGARYNRYCDPNASKWRMAIHHTVTAATTNAAGIRSIEYFHVVARGWCDVGYHFLVTQDGKIYEARRLDRLGAHARGQNSGNIGISLVGCFQPGACGAIPSPSIPPPAMQNAVARLIRHLSGRHGIPMDRSRIRGHREHAGQNTSCPGDAVLVRLDNILSMARSGSAPAPTPPPPPPPVGCAEVDRVAGADRYGTAAALSRRLFPGGARTVVIASGADGSPDAIAAGPLARTRGGPLLLTAQGALPFETAKELGRLKPQKVIIVGGEGAISLAAQAQVQKLAPSVVRIAAPDRYGTAAEVARTMGAPNGLAFIVAGDGPLVDALSAGTLAGALHAPLLLVQRDQLPSATAQALAALKITRTVIVGGEGAVSAAVAAKLPNPTRIAGPDRYATAAAMANFARDKGVSTAHVFVTRADKLADALPVAPSGDLLLLTDSGGLSGPAAAFIRANSGRATLLGGGGALSHQVENGVCAEAKRLPKSGPALTNCATVGRVAGADRYETAAAVSRRLFPSGAQTVVIASGESGAPDALAAGPLARSVGGPLLLTSSATLPAAISTELGRLGATRAIVLGGEAAVSAGVVAQLQSRGLMVERIFGDSRFETNAKIAVRAGSLHGLVFVASGEDGHLVDALAAGGAAAALGAPLLFATADGLPADASAALSALGATRAIVVGGPSAIGAQVISALQARGLSVSRVYGPDRYATAVKVAGAALAQGVGTSEVYVSRGDALADALPTTASGKLILLSPTHDLAGAAAAFLAFHGQKVTLVGGTGALAPRVEDGACRAMRW